MPRTKPAYSKLKPVEVPDFPELLQIIASTFADKQCTYMKENFERKWAYRKREAPLPDRQQLGREINKTHKRIRSCVLSFAQSAEKDGLPQWLIIASLSPGISRGFNKGAAALMRALGSVAKAKVKAAPTVDPAEAWKSIIQDRMAPGPGPGPGLRPDA